LASTVRTKSVCSSAGNPSNTLRPEVWSPQAEYVWKKVVWIIIELHLIKKLVQILGSSRSCPAHGRAVAHRQPLLSSARPSGGGQTGSHQVHERAVVDRPTPIQ
jgi:hypothetical protein